MDAAAARRQLELAREAEAGLNGPDAATWLERLGASRDERERAFGWFLENDRQRGLEMAAALVAYWNTQALYDEGRRWVEALLARAPERTIARAKALYAAGLMAFRQGETDQTQVLTEESLSIAREVDDPATIVLALGGLARVGLRTGDYEGVRKLTREALAIAEREGDRAMRRLPLHCLAEATRLDGDYPAARALYKESVALNRELGNDFMIPVELGNLGAVELHDGNLDEAQAYLDESVRLAHERGDLYVLPYALAGVGELAAARRDWERAATLLAATEGLFEASGSVMDPADVAPFDAAVSATRSALDGDPFAAAWSRGRALDADSAVDLALSQGARMSTRG